MASLVKIEEFVLESTNIIRYQEGLDQYFEANGIPANSEKSHKRMAILISVIGAKAHDVLSNLCSPATPQSKTYAQLAAILQSH